MTKFLPLGAFCAGAVRSKVPWAGEPGLESVENYGGEAWEEQTDG